MTRPSTARTIARRADSPFSISPPGDAQPDDLDELGRRSDADVGLDQTILEILEGGLVDPRLAQEDPVDPGGHEVARLSQAFPPP